MNGTAAVRLALSRMIENLLPSWLPRTAIPEFEIFLRLVFAVLLGAIIGWEREVKNRPAGLRTHMLVSLASATFALVALELVEKSKIAGLTVDPIRAIEAVTAGVAFLAAGTILQSRRHVIGLTTGASLWLAGAIGVSMGTGLYSIAIAVTVFALLILAVLQQLLRLAERENKDASSAERKRP
jgi:putative Mg2+ transporter-C (MgtC) family protein